MKISFILCLATLIVQASPAASVLVANFDLGDSAASTQPTNPPVGPYGTPTGADVTTWTKVGGGTGNSGAMSGLTFNVFNGSGYVDSRGELDLLSDFVYQAGSENASGGAVGNWSLSGLTIGRAYRLYFLAPDGSGFAPTNVYGGIYGILANSIQTNNYSAPATVAATATGQSGLFGGTWTEGINFASFYFIATATSVTGFYKELAGNIQNNTGIAGLQVAVIPEPSRFFLVAGSLCAIGFRRKR